MVSHHHGDQQAFPFRDERLAGYFMGRNGARIGAVDEQGEVLVLDDDDRHLRLPRGPWSSVAETIAGARCHCIATLPSSPSTRRANSVHGSRPDIPELSASVTRTTPDSVR